MSEGKFTFKSNVGGIDIDFSDLLHLDKYKGLEGSNGSIFKGYDTIDSALVDWELSIQTKDYGIKSFDIRVTNVRVSIRDEDENILDIDFNCDEYNINHYIETNRYSMFPSSLYINLENKNVEVSF